jgi:hypothetical protein
LSAISDATPPDRLPQLEELARAADLCLKPRLHAVRLLQPPPGDQPLDCTFRLEARNGEGERLPEFDLELEIFQSGRNVNLMLSWVSDPEAPILWHGSHPVWMEGESGVRCPKPDAGGALEALGRRLLALLGSGG